MKERPGSSRAIWAWALFDFACSPFTTLVVTFIYATYFAQAVPGGVERGTVLWSRGVAITGIVVAILSPILGALADRGGYRKLFLVATTLVCVVATTALYWIEPDRVVAAIACFVIANVAFETAEVFYNAFLPDIAPPDRIGRVSGIGWGLGYAGGLLALVVALVALVQPETPWLGFAKEGGENIRATNLLVAVWFLVFSIPTFLVLREDKSRISARGNVAREAYRQLRDTFVEIRRYRQIVRLLLARLFYNDGLITVFAFGGIYAAGTFGFTFEEILVFGIVAQRGRRRRSVRAGLGRRSSGRQAHDRDQPVGVDPVGAARGAGAQQGAVLGGGHRRRHLRRAQSVGEPIASRSLRAARQGERVLRVLRVLRQGDRVPRSVRARRPHPDLGIAARRRQRRRRPAADRPLAPARRRRGGGDPGRGARRHHLAA